MRDQFNLSGDFRGAIVNINASLDRATQSVSQHEDSLALDADRLRDLLLDLRTALEASAPENADDAEALAVSTTHLIEAAVADRPNRQLVKGAIQAVLTGGKSLIAASPKIATTVNQIIDTVQKLQELSDG